MIMARQTRVRPVAIGIAASVGILFLVFLNSSTQYLRKPRPLSSPSNTNNPSSRPVSRLYGDHYRGQSSPADINRVTNATLGFSNVFVVGLPERSDKRDAMALASTLTGFNLHWVDGIRGESIPNKAVPFRVDRERLMETNLGSWRGHMNTIRSIVEDALESALILEDDMDWDVRLKSQLENVAKGSRSLLASNANPRSPYGDDWDVLWLGHCGEVFPEMLWDKDKQGPPKYVIENDETVPPLDKVTGRVEFHKGTRWVHVTGEPWCTFAYALSQRGARKVLFGLSIDRLTGPFDNALGGMCRNAMRPDGDPSGLNIKCISVTPPLFFHHKAKGLISGDSDIQKVDNADVRIKGTTENIVWSVRNNLKNMMMGTKIENQFEN